MDGRWSSQIRGNVSEDAKQYCMAIFKHFVNESHWFGSKIGHSVKLVEVNVWDVEDASSSSGSPETAEGSGRLKPARAETVFEVKVTEDMCNLFGIMHGACAAYLIDHCSVSSLVALGYHLGKDGSGLSQSMNIIWNEAAPIGSKLRIVNTSIILRGRVRTCKSDLWNGTKLCVTATHSLVNVPDLVPPLGFNKAEKPASTTRTPSAPSPSWLKAAQQATVQSHCRAKL